jgi:type IV pilus assembly protein PilW
MKPKREKISGYTLLELLVSMALGMLLLAALGETFSSQSKFYNVQEQVNEMQQNARAAMDVMTREIKMGGYDPAGTGLTGVPYNASQLNVVADLDGNGDPSGPGENITYSFDSANLQIVRNSGSSQILAHNIQALSFSYLDATGNSTTDTPSIRQIQISITARTSKPDSNSGYRTYQITALITPPNLAF